MSKDMLIRIVVGLGLILLLLVILYFGGIVQNILYSIVAMILVYEMKTLLEAKGLRPFVVPAYIFALLSYTVRAYLGMYVMLLFASLCVFATILFRIASPERKTTDMFAGLALFFYPLSFYIFFVLGSTLNDFNQSRVSMLLTFAAPCCADIFAYFIGVFFGKHKLCPHISPKKTIEGGIGALVGGCIGGVIVYFLQGIWGVSLSLWALVSVGFICGAVGQIGDLFASSIKRWAEVKDFGTILPGHGGMMDRLDSTLMCAPVVCMFFYILVERGIVR
ncbi:MAG: phosphatidate cytidylyltransferase [Clostridia bacterium]